MVREYKPGKDYTIKTKVYSRSGAKCRKCGRRIPYGSDAIWVRYGSSEKFYHPACYKRLKKK